MRKVLGLGVLAFVLSFFVGVVAVDAQTNTPTRTPTPTTTTTTSSPTPTGSVQGAQTPGAPATGFGY